jgi:hypothetical protein
MKCLLNILRYETIWFVLYKKKNIEKNFFKNGIKNIEFENLRYHNENSIVFYSKNYHGPKIRLNYGRIRIVYR